jgi:hypothetical protein
MDIFMASANFCTDLEASGLFQMFVPAVAEKKIFLQRDEEQTDFKDILVNTA